MPRMEKMDWERLLAIAPEELTEEEKDELFNSVAWYEFDPGLDKQRMKCIFRVIQEILKYKGDQVESLVVELDELAARQGEEEAQRHRKLIEEVEDLRLQLKSSQRRGSKQSTRSGIDNADLRQELLQCEANNEKLLAELKAREQDEMLEKKEMEKLSAQVASLEREKTELRRELAAVQNETSSRPESFDSPERLSAEKQQELIDSVHQKNRHISQLLNDVETVENENLVLREKLTRLRDELSEATKHLTQMTGELTSLKLTCSEQEQKMNLVEEQSIALRSQVAELVDQKRQRDTQLDDFSEALDSRVLDWKKLTEMKDAEIEKLNAKLTHLTAQAPNVQIDTDRSHVAMLMQTLQTREEQIADLQTQLAEATKEIHNGASIIEQIKSKKSKHRTAEVNVKLQAQLQLAENQLKLYESKIKDAEEDACVKAKEMTDMIIQLRQYESGEYGLYEAVGEIKELRKQLNVRDKHIAVLIQSANKLQAEASLYEEQNVALCEKLGLPPDSQISVDGVHSKRQKQKAMLHLRQHQAERLEEEKLQLRLINRKLSQHVARLIRQVTALGCEPTDSSSQEEDVNGASGKKVLEGVTTGRNADSLNREIEEQLEFYKVRVEEMTKENDALRKGMHEILDSIHNQDGSSSVHLESQCLERLLEALDSRHVSGWYHPAMRLQGQLQALEGSNTILREQLRESRCQENEAVQMQQKATAKIEEMEKMLASPRSIPGSERFVPHVTFSTDLTGANDSSIPGKDSVDSTIRQGILNEEYSNVLEQNKTQEKSLEESKKILADTKSQVAILEERYANDKTAWESEKESLEDKVASIEAKITEYNGHWEVLEQSPDELKRFLSESAKRLASAKSNEAVASRKCKALQDKENQLLKEKMKLNELVSSLEFSIKQKTGEHKRSKEMLTFQVASLQKTVNQSVPVTMLENANKDLNEITLKYRDLLQTEQSSTTDSQLTKRLEEEKEILQKDKTELSTSLQQAREKLHSLEALVMSLNQDTVTQDNHDNQISTLTKKLATLEMKELNERQRADHADKIYNIMKGQLQQLEGRNEEIASQSKMLILQNLELQQVERNLRDSLLTYVSREELQLVETKLQGSEAAQVEMKLERENLREMLEIAQEQVRTLELWKTTRDCEIDSLKQTVLQLQSSSDEKMVIARANQDTMSARVMEAEATKKAQNLQIENLKLQAANSHLETKLEENEKDFLVLQSNLIGRLKVLQQAIQCLRQQYIGSVPLTKLEIFYESMQRLKDERKRAWITLREAEIKEHETDTLKELLQVQLQAFDQLKLTLNSKSLQVVDWLSQVTDLKLKDLQSRKKVEFYEIQLQQAEERFQKQEKYITILERESVFDGKSNFGEFDVGLESRRSSESNQPAPEEAHKPAAALMLAAGDGIGVTVASNVNDAELASLKSQVTSLIKQVEQRDNLLLTKDKAITEIMSSVAKLPKQKEISVEKKVLESPENQALKTSLVSLESIVTQKEETIARYQNLIKESRDEHSRAAAQAQEELVRLQTALAQQTQAHNKLKDKLRQANFETKPSLSTIEQYITRMHELEDEVAELNTSVGNLSNQLHACRGEADRWRALADDRLKNMGELRKRLEEQHQAELESYKAETKRHKAELELVQIELNKIQESFKQHKEETAKSPTSSVAALRAQLADKDQEKDVLVKSLAELRRELAAKSDAVQKAAQTKASEENQSLKNKLKMLNDELALAKEEARKQSVKLKEFLLKKKEETRSEREEILMKKLKILEDDLKEERAKFDKEMSENILRRIKSAEEVARWEEKKRNQQAIEKLKEKLAEKIKDEEKLLRTDKALRETISRLDREKIALTNRSSKGTGLMESRLEALDLERAKLSLEVASLKSKLESQKRHSGGLGAAILEEKLEAQQRRIAILELGKKGVSAVSDEFEKLQEANSILQKANLRLESENLELRLDNEKNRSETPRLKEKVTHLEKYIALMKEENSSNTTTSSDGDNFSKVSEMKSSAELEKTVHTLKRVVEKLQIENKNLCEAANSKRMNGRASEDRLRESLQALEAEKKQLQEHYLMAMEHTTLTEDKLDKYELKIKNLEAKLSSLSTECDVVKTQLVQKTQLLDRVKGLLQRAALKEKHLNEQVLSLQRLVPSAAQQSFSVSSASGLRY